MSLLLHQLRIALRREYGIAIEAVMRDFLCQKPTENVGMKCLIWTQSVQTSCTTSVIDSDSIFTMFKKDQYKAGCHLGVISAYILHSFWY